MGRERQKTRHADSGTDKTHSSQMGNSNRVRFGATDRTLTTGKILSKREGQSQHMHNVVPAIQSYTKTPQQMQADFR